jgi:alkylhydroperoxidase family enzyme
MESMFLPDVEQHPKPSGWLDAIRSVQQSGAEYPQIWHLFAYLPDATQHLARFTQAILRGPSPLSAGMRELIAGYVSSRNQCLF